MSTLPKAEHGQRTCVYCGLPMGAGGFEPQPGRCYCCYGCYLVEGIVTGTDEAVVATRVLLRLGAGGFLAMTVMMVSLVLYTDAPAAMSAATTRALHWILLLFSAPAVAIMGVPFLRSAGHELRHGRLNTDALIAMGAFSAFGVSAYHTFRGAGHLYYDTAAMLLVLVTAGKLLEASAKSNTARLVRGLLALGPRTARRLAGDGEEEEVFVEQLRVGDRVVVRPGEQVPADGVIRSGSSAVQEATFTGEALPRDCGPDDRVFGGSINTDGRLVVETTAVGEEALLGQMARLVREAQAQRAPVERLADRLAALFVPLVWATALGAVVYWAGLHGDLARGALAALAVLVVACPCALGLATPLAVSVAVGRAARAGVLIRSGEALEMLPRLRHLFIDKTGTLTRNRMRLVAVAGAGEPDEVVLAWAATLESASEHPVGRALVAAAKERGLALGTVREFRAVPGRGVEGLVVLGGQERAVLAGSAAFLAERGVEPAPGPALPEGSTAVVVAWEGRVRGWLALADEVRPEGRGLAAALAALGLRVTLLSGDREAAARPLAAEVGIATVHAGCTPADKAALIQAARREGGAVGMVGDGINDAPALAAADVGIALAGGTNLAREAGDVVLLGDELHRIPWSIELARAAYRIIRQNLLWAFGYNTIALAVAFSGRLHPLLAAVLMLLSSLFVLGNSLRLLREGDSQRLAEPALPAG